MMEERGQVIGVETTCIWVETQRQSTCGRCQAEKICGYKLINQLRPSLNRGYVRASCNIPVNVGDEVTIGLSEQALLSASFLVYALPLFVLLAVAVIGTTINLPELLTITLSLVGLAGSFLGVRWWTDHTVKGRYEPVVLYRHVPLSASEPPASEPPAAEMICENHPERRRAHRQK